MHRTFITFCFLLMLLVVAVFFAGCSRDPNVRKQKYLDNGKSYAEAGKLDEAAIEYRNALSIDANYAEAHYRLASVYLKSERWPRAAQELTRTVELQPENYAARVDLAQLLIASGDLPNAKEQVDWVLQARPNDAKSHAVSADLLAAQGDFPGALQEAENAKTLSPSNSDSYLKLALMQLRNNQTEAAETNLKKAIELAPDAIAAHLMLANFYQVRSRFAEAEQQLRDAVQARPTDPEPVAALARLYLAEAKRSDAENLLTQTKRNFDGDSVGYRMLGDFYIGTDDLDKAVAEYRTLYKDHPKDIQVKKNFTDLLIHTKQFEEAEKVNKEILKADSNDTDGLIYRAQLQLQRGDTNGAISTMQAAVKNDPSHALSHYHLSVAYRKSGNLDSAERELRETVRLRPDLVDAQRELAVLAMRRGDMTTLAQTSAQIIAFRPTSAEGYALRAVSEINQKQFREADADVRRAIEVAPASAAGYVQLGNLNFAQQHFKEAADAYRSGLERDPRSNDALRGLMNSYVAVKQVDTAIAVANAQISKAPDNSGFYDLLGTVLFQQKRDLAQAKAAFAKSIQLDKNNTDALMKLGEVVSAAGQTDEAIATFQAAVKDNPEEAGFHLMLGQIFLSRQDWAGAEQEYQKVLSLHHDDPVAACNLAYVIMQKGGDLDVALSLAQTARRRMPTSSDAADTLGWVYYQKGAYRPAIETLEAAVSLMQQSRTTDNARYHYHLGMAYAKSGDASRAREQLKRMLKMNPDSMDAGNAQKELAGLKS